ncbi:MAG: hypothetical protein QMD71_04770 [bacterium]|nr:hypothetical protein [bacterium]
MTFLFLITMLGVAPHYEIASPELSSGSLEMRFIEPDSLTHTQFKEASPQDNWIALDKLHHFSYSFGITGLSYHVYHCQLNNPNPGARVFSISIASIAGIGKELLDKYYGKSTISYKDITADALGIVTATIIFTLYP